MSKIYEVIGYRNNFELSHADAVIVYENHKYSIYVYAPNELITTCDTLQEARNVCFDLGFIMA